MTGSRVHNYTNTHIISNDKSRLGGDISEGQFIAVPGHRLDAGVMLAVAASLYLTTEETQTSTTLSQTLADVCQTVFSLALQVWLRKKDGRERGGKERERVQR